jgi:RNA 2',3'-cyclic 3'-phosphodiesterase
MKDKVKRLFAGIKIYPDPTLLDTFSRLAGSLNGEKIKWVEPYNLHLTLWFFGNVKVSDMGPIGEKLRSIAGKQEAFTLQTGGCGYFGKKKQPEVIWIDTDLSEPLLQLANAMEVGLMELDLPERDKPFRSHITLGRVKEIHHIDLFHEVMNDFKNVTPCVTIVNQFSLIESELNPYGPKYTSLETYSLVH